MVYDNFDGYAQLARELKTPLQIGENFYGPRDLHKALRARACDYVMPDFMRIGGGHRMDARGCHLPAQPASRCQRTSIPSSAPM